MVATQQETEEKTNQQVLRVLAVADIVEPQLYNNEIGRWLAPIDLVISCGDLPPNYLDFLVSTLNTRLMHVIGNHCEAPHDSQTRKCSPNAYPGAFNLNGRATEHEGLLVAGLEGSPIYNRGDHQYTEQQMALNIVRLVPELILNKMRSGRYLDILVTHAPPRGIHDCEDVAHKGFTSFIPFIERFKPKLLLHGHTHRYQPMQPTLTVHGETTIINTFGHVLLELTRSRPHENWQLVEGSPVIRGRR